MAISFDAASTTTSGSATFSWNHTCTGATVLIVFIGETSATARSATGITYNGVAMTEVVDLSESGSQIGIAAYYLFNPTTGTNSIAVTMSGTASTFRGKAISLKGVDPGLAVVSTGSIVTSLSNSITDNLNTTRDGSWVITATQFTDSNTPSPGKLNVDMTLDSSTLDFQASAAANIGVYHIVKTTAGNVSFGWSSQSTGTNFWSEAGIAVGPYVFTASTGSFALTGQSANITSARSMQLAVATFTLTGFSALIRRITTITDSVLHSATITNNTRHTATVTNQSKNSGSITNQVKD